MRTRARINRIVLVLGLLGCLTGAPSAHASDYGVDACASAPLTYPFDTSRWYAGTTSAIRATADCPTGLSFSQPYGDVSRWHSSAIVYDSASLSDLTSVAFDISGGSDNGIKYYAGDCEGCEVQIAPGPGGSVRRVELELSGQDSFVFTAACEEDVCPAGPPVRLSRITFVARSQDEARIWVGTTPTDALREGMGAWINDQSLGATFAATDEESGVRSAVARIDNQIVWQSSSTCVPDISGLFLSVKICPTAQAAELTLPIAQFADGVHDFRLTSVNGAGATPPAFESKLRIDRTAPAKPQNLRLAGGALSGTSIIDSTLNVLYDDVGADPVTSGGSGYSTTFYDLDPRDSGLPDPGPQRANRTSTGDISVPDEGRWRVRIWSVDQAGNEGPEGLFDFTLDVTTPAPPQLEKVGWVTGASVRSGLDVNWTPGVTDPPLESGVCGYAFEVDETSNTQPTVNLAQLVAATSTELPRSLQDGRHFIHVRAVACNGLASTSDHAEVLVDSEAPRVEADPHQDDAWSSGPSTVRLLGTDTESGVAAIEYRLSGSDSIETIAGNETSIALADGDQTLTYRAIDRAGNIGEWATLRFRLDSSAPTVAFRARRMDDPLLVAADFTDEASGVVEAAIQIRRMDAGGGWELIGGVDRYPSGVGGGTVSRTIPEAELGPGRYAIRAVVSDRAGNQKVGSLSESSYLEVGLPLRAAVRFGGGIASVKNGKIVDASATTLRRIRFGEPVAVVGRLLDSTAVPLAGREISILLRGRGDTSELVARTDATGRYALKLPRTDSREVLLRFSGDHVNAAATKVVRIKVRAKLNLKLSRGAIRAGQSLKFSGQLASRSLGLPSDGKDVVIEFLSRGVWIPTACTAHTDVHGRFACRWRPRSAVRTTDVWFHARITATGWSFETGVSKAVKLRIRP